MFGNAFLDKLREKYKYNNKTIKALSLIIPSIIKYYGEEYEEIILSAIYDCEIICCNSHETISKVLRNRRLTKMIGISSCYDLDIKRAESVYVPNVKIIYNKDNNNYEIDKIDRVIVTSHTFNYDSLKGIEVLTHALCHLVKSYSSEIIINENIVAFRSGISYENRKLFIDDGEVIMSYLDGFGSGLEEGFNLYDTENIVSLVCSDNYKCYDFDSIYTVASILKEKYKFLNEINKFEIMGDTESFKLKYGDAVFLLGKLCDQCVDMENEMFLSYTRDEKNKIAMLINKKLSDEVYECLVSIYSSIHVVR